MRYTLLLALILLIVPSCRMEEQNWFIPDQLKCNNLDNPAGVDDVPAFSWLISAGSRGVFQSAFQIILDSDPLNLDNEAGCLWNSGKIAALRKPFTTYKGPALKPAERYYWKVRVWDNNDQPSGWSGPSFFITGLIEKSDWSGAKWIGYEEIPESLLLVPGVHGNGNHLGGHAVKRTVVPLFRKEFTASRKIDRALVFISSPGHYELYINGDKTGDRFLAPGWTNYDVTCLYNTFDVTDAIKRGNNVMGAIAGNGFYNINRERYRKLVITQGAPKLILKLIINYSDGSEEIIVSDETWRTSPSPITFSSIYGGEDYDARLEQDGWDRTGFDDTGWKQALSVREPAGRLEAEQDYPLKVMQIFEPLTITQVRDTAFIYDFSQNASGIVKLAIRGEKGQKVRLIPGELLGDDSLVTQKATGSPYLFTYTLKGGKEEIWMPRFTYYGFRYVQALGAVPAGTPNPGRLPVINGLKMLHTRNSSPTTGSFSCSNELFNSVYELINWSIRSNLASVATDCPHREKLGWLEQTHLMGNSIKYLHDIRNLYNKIIDDMMGAQLENGLVPDIAPEYVPFAGGFRDSPEWGSACVILPWNMYEWYGDTEPAKKAYPMMKKYVGYLGGMAKDNILTHGLGDWYDLGPAFPGEAQLTPKALTATSIYYYDVKLLSEMAALTGETEDSEYFRTLAEEIRQSFNREFFNPATGVYSTGSQTAFAMPLFFGIPDSSYRREIEANLIRTINGNGKALTAGDIGYRYLLKALVDAGESQLIFEMNSRSDVPGYGFQLSGGATALTESWAGLREVSNNHMMLGHLMEWFFSGIGGIKQVPGSRAYEHILISPAFVGDLTYADATFSTVSGPVTSSWNITDDVLTMRIIVPVNCRATVEIPGSDPAGITESGESLEYAKHVRLKGVAGGKTICETGSGEYIFRTPFRKKS